MDSLNSLKSVLDLAKGIRLATAENTRARPSVELIGFGIKPAGAEFEQNVWQEANRYLDENCVRGFYLSEGEGLRNNFKVYHDQATLSEPNARVTYSISKLKEASEAEKNAKRKAALDLMIGKLENIIDIGAELGSTELDTWLKKDEYKNAINTLQCHSCYTTILNVLSYIVALFNPYREDQYAENQRCRGNRYMFWDNGVKQKAEVALSHAQNYFQVVSDFNL